MHLTPTLGANYYKGDALQNTITIVFFHGTFLSFLWLVPITLIQKFPSQKLYNIKIIK